MAVGAGGGLPGCGELGSIRRMFRIACTAWLAAVVVFLSSCASTVVPAERWSLSAEGVALLERCRGANRVEIFEGLPHQDSVEFLRESLRPDTFVSHGFAFYRPAMTFSPRRVQSFAAPLVGNAAHSPWSGMKFCGPYHPDYMLRFHDSAGCVEMHFCLGCGEAVFHTGATSVRTDVAEHVRQPCERALDRRRQKRPATTERREGRPGVNAIDALLNATHPAP